MRILHKVGTYILFEYQTSAIPWLRICHRYEFVGYVFVGNEFVSYEFVGYEFVGYKFSAHRNNKVITKIKSLQR